MAGFIICAWGRRALDEAPALAGVERLGLERCRRHDSPLHPGWRWAASAYGRRIRAASRAARVGATTARRLVLRRQRRRRARHALALPPPAGGCGSCASHLVRFVIDVGRETRPHEIRSRRRGATARGGEHLGGGRSGDGDGGRRLLGRACTLLVPERRSVCAAQRSQRLVVEQRMVAQAVGGREEKLDGGAVADVMAELRKRLVGRTGVLRGK